MTASSLTRPTLGLLMAHPAEWYIASLQSGIVEAARQAGVNLLSLSIGTLPNKLWPGDTRGNILLDFIHAGHVDGLLLIGAYMVTFPDEIAQVQTRYHPVPLVSIGTVTPGVPAIMVDNVQGMRAVVSHLIEVHGRRRIAFLRGPIGHPIPEMEGRYQGYVAALEDHHIPQDPELVWPVHNFDSSMAAKAVNEALQRRVEFDAIAASTDRMAVECIPVLNEAGRRVPSDITLVGFDNDKFATLCIPPLTTVHQPLDEVGRQAVERVLALVRGEKIPLLTLVPTEPVIRRSCGCLPETTPPSQEAALEAAKQPVENRLVDLLHLLDSSPSNLTYIRKSEIAPFGQPPDWRQRLQIAWEIEIRQRSPGRFLEIWDDFLCQLALTESDMLGAQALLNGLWSQTISGVSEPERNTAEQLRLKAQNMLAEALPLAQARQAIQDKEHAAALRNINRLLLTTFHLPDLLDLIASELPRLDIHRCYLALYEGPTMPPATARLVLAFDEQGRMTLPPEGLVFTTERFFPASILPEAGYVLNVEPLYFQDIQVGYIGFEVVELRSSSQRSFAEYVADNIGQLELCRALAQQLSAALYGGQLYREAVRGRQAAEEADHMKSRFLASVSHELRTPLNLIAGLSEMLLQEQTEEETSMMVLREDVEKIHTSARHLGWLIRDVLDLSSSQAGQLHLNFEPLEMGEILQTLVAAGEQMTHDKSLLWSVSIPANLPKIWGDRTRLRQVGLNLLSNAVKFTEQGQVTLQVAVEETDGRSYINISVSDTGLGIPPEEQLSIFDEFRQSGRTAGRGFGGLGLGLAISKRLVELHEGEIGVTSTGEENAGSTFYFRLPIMAQTSPGLPDLATAPDMEVSAAPVLVLTQTLEVGEELRRLLQERGDNAIVHEVSSTSDWLARILAEPLPGAVALESQLAAGRGWEIVKALGENPATCKLPILIYALAAEAGTGSLLTLDYLPKPLSTEQLEQALEQQGMMEAKERKTIAVVDDEPGMLDMHTRMVQARLPDSEVLKARNGREGLELIRERLPDLVLLDLRMPEMDGFEVLEALRQGETTRDIPVIVLTAQVLTEADMARLSLGVATILQKGMFSVEETLAHITDALTHNRGLSGQAQRLVRRVMAYIHENYSKQLARSEMAQRVGVSEDHLTRIFRQETGLSPVAYLNRYRVNKARQLLTQSDKSTLEIALAVGFTSPDYFGRIFHREVGKSPSAYRQKNNRKPPNSPA